MAPKIAVVGSLNIDVVTMLDRMPKIGETLRGKDLKIVPGGKGANQAVGCSRLSLDTVMIGAVGNDAFGSQIKNNLAHHGVQVNGIETIDGVSTGTAIISHTAQDNSIVIVGGANDYCLEELVVRHKEMITNADVILMQLEIPIQTVQKVVEFAAEAKTQVILNPAPAQPLPDFIKRQVKLLTPNETEWELISGQVCETEEDYYQSLSQWERKYGSKVIVTRGEKGCLFLEKGRLQLITAPSVNVIDTTGAGDAFNAAMAFGLAHNVNNTNWHNIASFAVLSASLSVQRFGAQAGMPSLEEVRAFEKSLP